MRNLEREPKEPDETQEQKYEKLAQQLFEGAFDRVTYTQRTRKDGENDKKGIDVITDFSEDRVLIDITTANPEIVAQKIESMKRSPATTLVEEPDDEGRLIQQSKETFCKLIFRLDKGDCEDFDDILKKIEQGGGNFFTYATQGLEDKLKRKALDQMIRQIDILSDAKESTEEYRKKAKKLKEELLKEKAGIPLEEE